MITVTKTCIVCGKTRSVTVPEYNYRQWLSGRMRIQDAFPELSDDERELLVSGVCGPCFDKMFAE